MLTETDRKFIGAIKSGFEIYPEHKGGFSGSNILHLLSIIDRQQKVIKEQDDSLKGMACDIWDYEFKVKELEYKLAKHESQLEYAKKTLRDIRSTYQGMMVSGHADKALKVLGEPCFEHYKSHGNGD
jgi:hypothetical protein